MEDTDRHSQLLSSDKATLLRELDPMPIVDAQPTATDGAGSPSRGFSTPNATATTSSLGLTSTGNGAIYYLSRIQRYSSYAFAIFSSVHLVTASVVPLATQSVSSSESYLLLAREIYQTRVSEPLLVVIPVVAHVTAGIALRLLRRSQNLRRYGEAYAVQPEKTSLSPSSSSSWSWWHPRRWWHELSSLGRHLRTGWPPISMISVSGFAFTAALSGHVFLNRLLPLAVEGDSADIGLAYVSHGFSRHPVVSSLYYTFLLAVSSGHMVWGWARWLNIAQRASWGPGTRRPTGNAAVDKAARKRRRRTWLVIQGSAFAVFLAWAAGGLGVVGRGGRMRGWIGDIYDGLYDKAFL